MYINKFLFWLLIIFLLCTVIVFGLLLLDTSARLTKQDITLKIVNEQLANASQQSIVIQQQLSSSQQQLTATQQQLTTTQQQLTTTQQELTDTQHQLEISKQELEQINKKTRTSQSSSPASAPTSAPASASSSSSYTSTIPASNQPAMKETYVYSDNYPIILSLSDNKDGIIKASQFNSYSGQYSTCITGISLKMGDEIQWTVQASDPKGRQLYYSFNSNSQYFNSTVGLENGQYKWYTSNTLKYTIGSEDIRTAGETLRIVADIKCSSPNLRFPSGGYDDCAYLDYKLLPQ